MNRRFMNRICATLLVCASVLMAGSARATDEAPDALIKRLSTDILDNIKVTN